MSAAAGCAGSSIPPRETFLHAVRDVVERLAIWVAKGTATNTSQRRAPRRGNAIGGAHAEAASAGQKSVIFAGLQTLGQGLPPQQTPSPWHSTSPRRPALGAGRSQVITPGRKLPTSAAGPPTCGTTRGSPPAKSACRWRRSKVGTRGAPLSHQLPKFSFVAQPCSQIARAVRAEADAVVFSSEINCATNPAQR